MGFGRHYGHRRYHSPYGYYWGGYGGYYNVGCCEMGGCSVMSICCAVVFILIAFVCLTSWYMPAVEWNSDAVATDAEVTGYYAVQDICSGCCSSTWGVSGRRLMGAAMDVADDMSPAVELFSPMDMDGDVDNNRELLWGYYYDYYYSDYYTYYQCPICTYDCFFGGVTLEYTAGIDTYTSQDLVTDETETEAIALQYAENYYPDTLTYTIYYQSDNPTDWDWDLADQAGALSTTIVLALIGVMCGGFGLISYNSCGGGGGATVEESSPTTQDAQKMMQPVEMGVVQTQYNPQVQPVMQAQQYPQAQPMMQAQQYPQAQPMMQAQPMAQPQYGQPQYGQPTIQHQPSAQPQQFGGEFNAQPPQYNQQYPQAQQQQYPQAQQQQYPQAQAQYPQAQQQYPQAQQQYPQGQQQFQQYPQGQQYPQQQQFGAPPPDFK